MRGWDPSSRRRRDRSDRTRFCTRCLGDYPGHVASTALAVAAIPLVSPAFSPRTPVECERAEIVGIGAFWTVLTVDFEFAVGYVEGTPVSVTVGQCDVLAGQGWIAVPTALASHRCCSVGSSEPTDVRGPRSPTWRGSRPRGAVEGRTRGV